MSQPSQASDRATAAPAGLPRSELVERVCRRFDEAWQRALRGEPQPQLETFLQECPETEQALLRPALQEVHSSYLRRLAPGGATVDLPANCEPPSEGAVTVTHHDVPADPGATLDIETKRASRSTARAFPEVPGYEILGELGRGGMGVVYKARHVRLNRMVALKMVLAGPHASAEELARFLIEAEAVAQLMHPNIVQIFEIGELAGLPYFSLEFVDGNTLRQKIGGRPQPVRDAAELIELLALAMASAHDHGIVHRDLKPANVLLTSDGLPKITDFGLAKRLEGDSSQTKSGTLMGTPQYMAPEQARGAVHQIGPPADVYALGVILYEMLTGRTPFVGASIMETLTQVQTLEPVPPRQVQPKVPVDLETICLKCLQKEQHKRYPKAEALAADLHAFLAGEPIQARPIGAFERFTRWCRRNPRVAALTGVIFVLLVAIAATSSVLLVKIAYEKEQTEIERQAAVVARELAERNEGLAKTAQRQAEVSEQQAKENARIAVEQGRLAINTFYQVVTRVQQQLRASPGNQKLRQELLTDAFAGIEKVLIGTESSPLLQRTRAAAFQHLGDISRELGRTEVALKHYHESQKIIEALAAEDSDNPITRWNQSVIYEKLGDTNHQFLGDGAVAREYYRKCLDLRRSLAAGPISAPELKESVVKEWLALVYVKQGNLALMLGDPVQAWDHYRTFFEHRLGKVFDGPGQVLPAAQVGAGSVSDVKDAKPGLFTVTLCLRLGELGFHLGDRESCQAWYEAALKRADTELRKNAQNDALKQQLAACLSAFGDLELQTGDPAGAQKHYTEAHALIESAAAANRDNAPLRRALAFSHYRLGTAYLRMRDAARADKHYQECRALREQLAKEDLHSAYNQIDLMVALARCGEQARARELAGKLRARAPDDPGMLFFVACGEALCAAKTPEAADAAFDALARAIHLGYRDEVALRHDPDLEELRSRPRFQELLAALRP